MNSFPFVALRRACCTGLHACLHIACVLVGCSLFSVLALVGRAGEPTDDLFEQRIRPALIEHCYECHSQAEGKAEGGLVLDSQPGMLEGGDSGPAIIAGNASESLLIEAIRYQSLEMPPKGKLDAATIQAFEDWIAAGAADPRTQRPAGAPAQPAHAAAGMQDDWDTSLDYWSFRSPQFTAVPAIGNAWARSPIDAYVFDKLQEHDLQPAPEADRATWLRRVSFDLTGLPPSLEELDAFLGDVRSDAYERVVERLLASPRYGERWARHWLDVARYADSNGADENHEYPHSWRYRDYVVAAFNQDKAYDRFVHEQLAGDLLPADSDAQRGEQLTATGFLVIGPKMLAEQDKEKMVADIVDEQLDTVGKVFLGLTLGCSRCHDHKFDPIRAEDYYALAGIFHSTRTMEHLDFVSQWNERKLPDAESEERLANFERALAARQMELGQVESQVREADIAAAMLLLQQTLLDAPSAEAILPMADFRKQLEHLVQEGASFEVWRELASLPESQFPSAAQTQWDALHKLPSTKQAPHDLSHELSKQPLPNSRKQLAESLALAIGQRWREVAGLTQDDQKALFKLGTCDQELFGKEAVFDVQRDVGAFLPADRVASLAAKKKEIEEFEKERPDVPKAMAAEDAPVKLVSVHVRGNHLQQVGDPLPRRVPSMFRQQSAAELADPSFPSDGSGRLEFARWLTHPKHPLTARVMVNRIWQGHFGEGLVSSSSNFGLRGDLPSHPELLDWLALSFEQSGWSIKQLHREIVLSSTYRMAWVADERAALVDPENRLLWRHSRQRLEAEAIRDSLLAIAGELDYETGGKLQAAEGSYPDTGSKWGPLDTPRRTLYLPINRAALNDFFSTFDYVDPAASLERRSATIVPHQTLFLLNHPLAMHAGWALAGRVMRSTESPIDRVRTTYAIAFSRYPSDEELQYALDFIDEQAGKPLGQGDRDSAEDQNSGNGREEAWVRFCRGILLTNELLYVE